MRSWLNRRERCQTISRDLARTYFINSCGDEAMGSTWSYLDMTALGRQEEWEDSPEGYPQTPPYKWWNWHPSSQWNSIVDGSS
jgi:predicted dithiol-disulfide oxidoreductase (DUF899 family)